MLCFRLTSGVLLDSLETTETVFEQKCLGRETDKHHKNVYSEEHQEGPSAGFQRTR